jgi:hypothetical protein
MTVKNFTPKQEKLFRELWLTGMTCDEIAKKMSLPVTRGAIAARAFRMGLPLRKERHNFTNKQRRQRPHPHAADRAAARPHLTTRRRPPRSFGPGVGLLELAAKGQCRRVISGTGYDTRYCGEPTYLGSWCRECAIDVVHPGLYERYGLTEARDANAKTKGCCDGSTGPGACSGGGVAVDGGPVPGHRHAGAD